MDPCERTGNSMGLEVNLSYVVRPAFPEHTTVLQGSGVAEHAWRANEA
jgi:hypothetical protein